MIHPTPSTATAIHVRHLVSDHFAQPAKADSEDDVASQLMLTTLKLLNDALEPEQRVVRTGDVICRAGERFGSLYVLNSGFIKIVSLSADGREQVVGLKFRGDWLGFDGIADARYCCDSIAMDTGEVWTIRYDALLAACPKHPALLTVLHEAISREIGRDRDSLMSVCTLPAEARVADFLRYWAESLARHGLRTDIAVTVLGEAVAAGCMVLRSSSPGRPGQ